MSLSIHSTSVGIMSRMLGNLSAILDAAVDHAEATRRDPATLLSARLAPDMRDLVGQVQMATDTAKFAGARLAGMIPPAFEDDETSFPELQERISKTLRFIEVVDPSEVEAASSRIVTIAPGGKRLAFRGVDYLRQFALPNFFFHVTTAYAILRAEGVPLAKLDYLGPLPVADFDETAPERRVQYG